MRLAALLLAPALALSAPVVPASAQTANLLEADGGSPGAAARLILAQRTYEAAMDGGDAILLLTAIRLAREIVLRPPTAWTRTTTGEPPRDEAKGATAPPDPAGPQVLAVAQALAGEDPDMQDLVYALDAQLPHARRTTATGTTAQLGGGQTDRWQMVLFGDVPAEIGLIGDGDSPLSLTVTDEGGAAVCVLPPGIEPGLCAFTPARNGFFTVDVRNMGQVENSYRLIGD